MTIDEFWYPNDGESANSLDQYGRAVVDESKWPSAKGGNGFKIVSARLHSLGLKLGIHVMHGIPRAALNGSYAHAALTIGQFGGLGRPCAAQRMSQHALSPLCRRRPRCVQAYAEYRFLYFLYFCQCEASAPPRARRTAVRSRYHVLGRAEVSVASLSDGTWCPWNTAWGRIDMEKPGAQVYCPAYRASTHALVGTRVLGSGCVVQEYHDSIYAQYAEWGEPASVAAKRSTLVHEASPCAQHPPRAGVDFNKNDCVFGNNFNVSSTFTMIRAARRGASISPLVGPSHSRVARWALGGASCSFSLVHGECRLVVCYRYLQLRWCRCRLAMDKTAHPFVYSLSPGFDGDFTGQML